MNVQKLTQKSIEAIQGAQNLAMDRRNPQVEQEHLLLSLLQPHILQLHSFPLRGDLGIIGGADGPTSIIVASAKPTAADFLVHLLVIAAAVYGLSRTKKP